MARGRLRLSPRLKLSPTTATTDLDTMDLATGPTATVMDFTTARGRLRPSLRLRLSPTMATTDLATMDFTTARGRLKLSQRLILTCCTVATGPTAMATPPTATAMDSAMATATVLATGPTGDKLL